MKNHQDIVKCLREKPLTDLHSVELKAPSFLTAMGPSRDGVLIPSDFGTSSFHIHRKRSTVLFNKITMIIILIIVITTRCHRTRSSLASPTARQRNSSQRSSLSRGSHSTNKRGEQRFIFWLNQESPNNRKTDLPMKNELQIWSTLSTGCYGRWWGTLICTTWTRSSTRWRTSTVRSVPPPPLKQFGTRFFQWGQSFSSLSRFPRRWGTSCTCRLRWRLPLGATSLATWFTSTSIPPWSHDYSD